MIKDIVLKYENVAFLCSTKQEFIDFVSCATKEIIFSKMGWEEDKDYILKNYLYENSHLNGEVDNLFALICYVDIREFTFSFPHEHSEKKILDKGKEFQFYARNYDHWTNPNKYGGSKGLNWDRYTIINATKFLRKQKLKKLINA